MGDLIDFSRLKKGRETKMGIIVTPSILANNILQRSMEQGIPVSPMKLQKLIYFIYRDYLKLTDESLFSENFEVWKYGPVLPSIYHEFKKFGGGEITSFSEVAGEINRIKEIPGDDFTKIINEIWSEYKNKSGQELSKITHAKGSAWSAANEKRSWCLYDEDIKNDNTK